MRGPPTENDQRLYKLMDTFLDAAKATGAEPLEAAVALVCTAAVLLVSAGLRRPKIVEACTDAIDWALHTTAAVDGAKGSA